MNPALLKSVAPSGYQMHVPKGTSSSVVAAMETIPEIHRATWRLHRVLPGETLVTIAKQFGTPADSLAAANRHTVESPEAGDLLVVPTSLDPNRTLSRRAPVRIARRTPVQGQAKRVSAQVLNRKAAPPRVKTAGLAHTRSAQ